MRTKLFLCGGLSCCWLCIFFFLTARGTLQADPGVYLFNTIAGSPGIWGSTDGTNRNATFMGVGAIAVDSSTNLFVVDSDNIRKISTVGPDWVVSTPARGFTSLYGVAADGAGNLYVTDYNAIQLLRHVGNDWVASTIAGVVGQSGSRDGTNFNALFWGPVGIAVDDAGNVYVSDQGNCTIRKISPVGADWVVTTIAGLAVTHGYADGTNGQARFWHPWGLAVDKNRNVYVAGYSDQTIRKISPVGTNWVVTTVAGLGLNIGSADGTNYGARFNQPAGVAVDSAGNLYVADNLNDTIRKITPVGTNWVVTTIGGQPGVFGSADGTNSQARFFSPFGVAVDAAGNVYVADSANYVVRQGVLNGSVSNLYPVARCRDLVVDATNGFAYASVDNGSFDPDGDPIMLSQSPAGPYPIGSNFVTLTVTDSKGASSQCLDAVIVRDPTPPSIGLTNQSAVQMSGHAGQVVVVQSSTDLVHWMSVTTNTMGSSPQLFNDTSLTNSLNRYYRLKLWP